MTMYGCIEEKIQIFLSVCSFCTAIVNAGRKVAVKEEKKNS